MGEPVRFTPEEIQELVDSDELTEQDIWLMDKADQKVAFMMMADAGKAKVMGQPLLPSGAIKAAPAVFNAIKSRIPDVGGSIASAIGGTAGYHLAEKLGLPGYIGAIVGGQAGFRGTKAASKPRDPAKKGLPLSPLERKAPIMTGKEHGPRLPKEGLKAVPDPPNLQRQGNVTNPGPFGPGSPSVGPRGGRKPPSGGDKPKPFSEVGLPKAAQRGGKPAPKDDPPNLSRSKDPSDSPSMQGVPKGKAAEDREPTRRGMPDRRSERGGGRRSDDVSEARYQELLAKFGGQPGSRRPPGIEDETDVRKVLFGGVGATKGGEYKSPSKRGPLTKREIEELIAQLLGGPR